ncbi:hypothetical protein [Shouchella shacheensis]|uniref:hypothetical protein n=1 Tax=Shouchella shacheensis TaxID=1649580 RepID=UPI0007400B95|nr:hypothetical protein [Shouchella shacheensis]
MKRFFVTTGIIGILFLLGTLLGVQMMSEQYGFSEPAKLSTPEEREAAEKPDPLSVEKKKEADQLKRATGPTNFFSDLGSSFANTFQAVTLGGLDALAGFVHNVINKNYPEEDKSRESFD